MHIEFLGHAGFSVLANEKVILLDPWLTPSTVEAPVLSSLAPSHSTIDYLIPEPKRNRETLSPDIILLSHYHTHHAPKTDIEFWLRNAKKSITLVGPQLYGSDKENLEKKFAQEFPSHNFIQIPNDQTLEFGNVEIKCLSHTVKGHLAYFIKINGNRFLHIADAVANRVQQDKMLDPVWHKFISLNPTFVALSAGTTSTRIISKDNTPQILENSIMSAVEAAKLVRILKPKMAAIMGVYNFSVFKNRIEFSFSASENENYFRWAVQHLHKETDVLSLTPGMSISFDQENQYYIRLSPTL